MLVGVLHFKVVAGEANFAAAQNGN